MARLRADGVIGLTDEAHLYVYRARKDGHSQTGIAGAMSIAAYEEGRIRRHELTRPSKVGDRARQIAAVGAHTGPVMLSHRDDAAVAAAIAAAAAGRPALEAEIDGVSHAVWIADGAAGAALAAAIEGLETLYIADGHHRSEAASQVAAGGNGRVLSRRQLSRKRDADPRLQPGGARPRPAFARRFSLSSRRRFRHRALANARPSGTGAAIRALHGGPMAPARAQIRAGGGRRSDGDARCRAADQDGAGAAARHRGSAQRPEDRLRRRQPGSRRARRPGRLAAGWRPPSRSTRSRCANSSPSPTRTG